jgi:hypothetical protein
LFFGQNRNSSGWLRLANLNVWCSGIHPSKNAFFGHVFWKSIEIAVNIDGKVKSPLGFLTFDDFEFEKSD